MMNGDGGSQVRLTTSPGVDGGPAWSPDGKQIAFASNRNNSNPYNLGIWVMNIDGTGLKQLTTDPEYDSAHDGRRMEKR
jgi:TolB protein